MAHEGMDETHEAHADAATLHDQAGKNEKYREDKLAVEPLDADEDADVGFGEDEEEEGDAAGGQIRLASSSPRRRDLIGIIDW